MEDQKQRPVPIAILAVFNVIVGSVLMLAGLGATTGAQGALLFGAGAFGVAVAVGLFLLRPWARIAAIVCYLINVGVALVEAKILGAVIASAILAYLLSSPRVRVAFASEAVPPATSVGAIVEERP